MGDSLVGRFSTGLPNYERPPVVEVVLGVQLRPLQIAAIDLGSLREIWREEYPTVVQQAPLPPTSPDDERSVMPVISFGPPPMMRYWWLSQNEERLLQVQQDRFILNWRRKAPDQPYPRYPELRARFDQHFTQFRAFAAEISAGPVEAQQAEVTYINDLGLGGTMPALDEALTAWTKVDLHHLGEPEEVRFAEVFTVPSMSPLARLYISLDPHKRADGTETTLLTLTVRGHTAGPSPGDVLSFLDTARGHIVTSFSEITSETMQLRWGRK